MKAFRNFREHDHLFPQNKETVLDSFGRTRNISTINWEFREKLKCQILTDQGNLYFPRKSTVDAVTITENTKLSTGLVELCRDESVTIVKSQVSFHYLNVFKKTKYPLKD